MENELKHKAKINGPKNQFHHKAQINSPTAAQIRRARDLAGLTREEAALKIEATVRAWQGWEQATTMMHPGLWRYFLLVIGQSSNPEFKRKNGLTL